MRGYSRLISGLDRSGRNLTADRVSEELPSRHAARGDGLTFAEACDELHVDRTALRTWIMTGKLPSYKTAAGSIRISRSEIDRLLGRAD